MVTVKTDNQLYYIHYIVGMYMCVWQYIQWDIVEALELEHLVHWLGSNVEREL